MSGKGGCRDNACSETLFGSLKVERLQVSREFQTNPRGGQRRDARPAAPAQRIEDAFEPELTQPSSVREAVTRSNSRPRGPTRRCNHNQTKVQNRFAYETRSEGTVKTLNLCRLASFSLMTTFFIESLSIARNSYLSMMHMFELTDMPVIVAKSERPKC
jgi:hypothetical protein